MGGRAYWEAAVTLSASAQASHSPAAITSPYEGSPLDLTVCVYCHNAEATAVKTLEAVAEAMRSVGKPYEIIAIDDFSKDATGDRIRQYIGHHPELNIVLRAGKRFKGVAQNYIDAAFIGRGKYFRLVFSDNREPMETMADIFRSVGDADIVVPYSMAAMEQTGQPPFVLAWGTRIMNLLSGERINDFAASPMHLRYNVMRWRPASGGAFFQADLLIRLLELGFTCKQVPCRNAPQTKAVTWQDGLSMAHVIGGMAMRRISRLVQQ